MKAKNKRRLNRMMSIILVFMLMSYYVPIGLVVATAEGEENPEQSDVFTLELVNEETPVNGAIVKGTNGFIEVTGTTDDSGIVMFNEVTNEHIQKSNRFEFEVELQDGQQKEFNLVVENGLTEKYKIDISAIPTKPVIYTVTVNNTSTSGSGTIKVNNENYVEPLQFTDGENVKVEVNAESDSKIESLIVDGTTITIPEDGKYADTINVNKDIVIEVKFTKIYTISFTSNENGTIDGDDYEEINATEGKIVASHGTSPSFTATPEKGYHLSKVTIDKNPIDLSSLEDGDSYTHIFDNINGNHRVEITFTLSTYEITTSVIGGKGTISDDAEVSHGGNTEILIVPEDTYQIKTLTDNGSPVDLENLILQESGSYIYKVYGVVEDHDIKVEFDVIPNNKQPWEENVSISNIDGEEIYSIKEENLFVYSHDAKVKIEPINNWAWIKINNGSWKREIYIDRNTVIEEIQLGKFFEWEEISIDPKIHILFDTQAPEIDTIKLDGSDKVTVKDNVWFSGGVKATVKVENIEQTYHDHSYYSNIDKVFYKKGNKNSKEEVKTAIYNEQEDSYEITIPDEDYSGNYSFWVVDEAGNESDIQEVRINIDQTNPSLPDGEAVTFKQVNQDKASEVINFLTFGTFFNESIEVTVQAFDQASGIKTISLINDSGEALEIEESDITWDGSKATKIFTIDKNNLSDSFTVKLTDNTNNEDYYKVTHDNSNIKSKDSGIVMIEKEAPTAEINLTSGSLVTDLEDGEEFNQDINLSLETSDLESGLNEVIISVNDQVHKSETYRSEKTIEKFYTISTEDLDSEDGEFTISLYVIDNAGNTTTVEKTVYVDKTNPIIKGISLTTEDGTEEIDEEDILKEYVELEEYGYYFKKSLQVNVVAEDMVVDGEHTSGVQSMVVYLKDHAKDTYYAVLQDGTLSDAIPEDEIKKISPIETDKIVSFTIEDSFKGQIIAKATDLVGNTGEFESTYGTILESPEQHEKEEHITYSKADTPHKDINGIDLYSENVNVELTVTDTYSGIEKIEWSVVSPNDTENNQHGNLTILNDGSYGKGSDKTGWEKTLTDHNLVTEMKKMIAIENNSNDIVLHVKMTDRAGNTSEEEIKFSIDKTAPDLKVEFDNNDPDEENGNVYDDKRIATITITERNFNPDDVQLDITNTGSTVPAIGEWTTKDPEEGEHPDLTTHTATIAFTEDGDYTFHVSYQDNAGNSAPDVEEHVFTIDQNAPEVSVSYDNNEVANGNYYNEKRIATITITEHNFDPNRVKITGSTTIIGETIEPLPELSEWDSNGDVHTATIIFEKDALYHYDIEVSDTAGNTSDDFEAEEFYIDKTDAVLVDGEAVTFKQKNDGTFAKVLNFLTFGTFFNKEVQITVQTLDATSGIEEIELKTVDGQLINQDDISINEDELTGEAVFVLDVDSFDAELEVDITDLAHNVGTYAVTAENSNIASEKSNIVVEKEKPNVTINVIPGKGVTNYKNQYNGDVTFEVVTEDLDSGINTVIIDVNGKKYEYDYSDLAEMQKKPDAYRINTNHKDIVGNEDGSYLISVHVVDNAGNENEAETKIYIDKTNPIITNYEFSVKGKNGFVKVDETDKFKKSLELTEYGYYFKEPTQVKISGEDPKVDKEFTSNLKTITVYLKDHENGKYYAALKNGSLKEIKESEIGSITPIPTKNSVTVNVPKAFKGQIFAQATDYVQNTGAYIAPNGMVVENKAQHNKETHIKLDRAKAPYKDNNGVDLYSNNVNVELTVTDSYSGIEEIEWSVIAPYDTGNNQGGKLKLNNDKTYADGSNTKGWKQTRTQLNLVTEMKKTITVNNNSNDIKVRVKMTDRAGHTSEEEITFSIDKTSPSINVTYDNNSPDPQNQDYYKDNRTATIIITERNFKPEDVVHVVTNTDNVIPVLNGWSTSRNSNNPDLTTHTATITYSADGDYTFDIQYTDNAGNKAAPVPQDSFTIDKTKPVINVSYDTDDAVNGNYFNTTRTATISITEHNFDPSRIEVIGTAFHDGEVVNFPSLSGWTRNGDVHTASIVYSNDALYTFDIDYTDMAGNVADDVTPQEFHVDQTEPELTIVGVENMSANNGEVAPIIRYSDTNFDPDSVEIELTGSNRGDVELKGEYSGRNNGQVFIFDDFARTKENDDLYTLSVSLVDLAGNESTEEIRFSVNRFGSVYAFDDSLDELVGKYVQNEQDIIITETNVNSLDKDSINLKMTHNGSPSDLKAGEDFTISETGGEDTWSQYTYTIHKELFAGDGRYTITLYSEDAAGNTNENIDEKKKAEISFGIDKTSPVVVPIDIEEGEQYAVDSKTATISVKDNLVLDQVKISLNNEEIAFEENGENYTFVIPNSNSTQEVTILATDAAGNEITAEVRDFLVTTNLLARWYNNKPLFFGSLGGTGVIGVALAAFFLYRKRNNVADEVEMEEKAG